MIDDMALHPEPVDLHVGARLKERRILLGLSQEKLAAGLGLTFQQLQKYESGINRVSASRLYQLAHLLGVDAPYFFEGLDSGAAADTGDADLLTKRETLEFVRGYNHITDEGLRRQVVDLIEAIAKSMEKPAAEKRAGASKTKRKPGGRASAKSPKRRASRV